MEGMEAGLTDLDLWSALVGIGMPPVVAIVVSARWQPWLRGLVAAAMCAGAGLATTWIAGDLTGVTPVRAVLVVAMATFGSYRTWWHTTGITKKIEDMTTPKQGRKRRPRRPKPLKAGQGSRTTAVELESMRSGHRGRPGDPTVPPPAEPWRTRPPGDEWLQ